MDEKRLTLKDKIVAALLCSVVFNLVYNGCTLYSKTLKNVPSFVFDFEKNIPFLSWMIVPYMTSVLFFVAVFFWCISKDQLKMLTKRVLFITFFAGFCFLLFPLKFSFPKPETENPLYNFLFQLLVDFDSPYNQAPSLHVAFAVLFWSVVRKKFHSYLKLFFIILLILLGISTLFVYQHHFIDILTGLILGQFSFVLFPNSEERNHQVADGYYLSGSLFFSFPFFFFDTIHFGTLLFLWFGINFYFVGIAYWNNDAHFLKAKSGKIPYWKKTVLLPYQLIYLSIWKLFRKQNLPTELFSNVFICSKLNSKEISEYHFDTMNTMVFDLSAELEENKIVRISTHYFSVPILDISTPDKKYFDEIIHLINEEIIAKNDNQKILIHCTMGYSRSSLIAIALLKTHFSVHLNEAISLLKKKKQDVHLPNYLLRIFN